VTGVFLPTAVKRFYKKQKMKSIKLKTYFFISISLILPILIFGQAEEDFEEKLKDVQWNIHKKEIGLDFKFLDKNLSLRSIGSNLIFKKHFGEKKFISRNEKKALRIQFGGSADYPIGQQDSLGRNSGFRNVSFNEQRTLNVRMLIGVEWQKQIKRIQLYYGLDIGIQYFERSNPYSITWVSFPSGDIVGYATDEESSVGIPLFGFMGLKYFIHPRVSISIESALNIGIGWSKYKLINYDNQFNETSVSAEGKRRELNFETDYVRFINVGFHF
jgi:hypothetical protein